MRSALAEALERAAATGIITRDQAEAILRSEEVAAPEPVTAGRAPARVPPALEALGYLGAIFVIVGAVTLVSGFWEDLLTWSRLAILGVVAAAFTAAGLAVRDEGEPALWRLRGFLLLLGSGALTGFSALVALDGFEWSGAPVAVFVGGLVSAHAGALWQLRDRPGQHLAFFGGAVAVVAGAVVSVGGGPATVGLALWLAGGAWLGASLRQVLPPAMVGVALGSALGLVAAGVTASQWNHVGTLFGLATAGLLIGVGIRTEEFLLTGIGVIGAFVYLPSTLGMFFGDTIGVPAVMLVSGLGLLGLTVLLLQRWGGPHPPTRKGWRAPRSRHA